ncbi:MAG: sulfur carrier protein ThiS [Proteobacteria bacterium]|nr:sulfur carrier protein ThiS [Pseudomonadota bacterium]NOG60418.1 sulfur carrier protein ThiS [Pseudomonadota bacterium]
MNILLNGDQHSIRQNSTIKDLVTNLQLEGKYAIEINQNIIPRSEYLKTELRAGDKIEIVQAIGGG